MTSGLSAEICEDVIALRVLVDYSQSAKVLEASRLVFPIDAGDWESHAKTNTREDDGQLLVLRHAVQTNSCQKAITRVLLVFEFQQFCSSWQSARSLFPLHYRPVIT